MSVFAGRPELLSAFRAGERDALEEIYWAQVDLVERILRFGCRLRHGGRRIPGAADGDLRDLVQEVFLRAFAPQARLRYDGLRDYEPYIAAVARHVLADWGRKRGYDFWVEDIPPGGEPRDEPVEPAEWQDPEALALVERYTGALEGPVRAVYEQRFVLGRSQEAAAATLGITRQQIRTLERRVRSGLRRELGRAKIGQTKQKSTSRRPSP